MRLALIAALILLAQASALALEEPIYTVVDATDNYEIRRYGAYIVAEIDVDGSMSETGSTAFRALAGYIFGKNTSSEKMVMTAPVETQPKTDGVRMQMTAPVESHPAEEAPGRHTYAFVMERKYTLQTLPRPVDSRIRLVTRPERTMAVRKYTGGWSESRYIAERDTLLSALDANGVAARGEPILARYDGPMTPWFMRRNEVMVELPVEAQQKLMSATP
jgi:hypothetical protein